MTQSKCPIYNTVGACTANPTCLFLRNGGCAVIIGMKTSCENKQKLDHLSSQLDAIQNIVADLADSVGKLR